MLLNRWRNPEGQKLFSVHLNGLQVLTNGETAEQAIAHAKEWVEVEGRESSPENFFKSRCGCTCDRDDDDDDECDCGAGDKKTKWINPVPVRIQSVVFNDDHMNIARFDAAYIVEPETKRAAKRGRKPNKK